MRLSVMAITALSPDLWLSPSDPGAQLWRIGGDDPQSLALVCMDPAGRSTFGSGNLAADHLVACEQRRAVDTGGVRNAPMATRCPRPWACSARRLGRLGRWLSRASHHAPTGLGLRLALVTQKSRAALPCSACAIELQDQHVRARGARARRRSYADHRRAARSPIRIGVAESSFAVLAERRLVK